MPTSAQYQDDDEAPAGAYGAYAVGSRRKAPRREPEPRHTELNINIPSQPPSNYSYSAPSSPEELDLRKPAVPDAYIASTFLAKAADIVASSVSSSKSSSQKSSPYRVKGKESASKAETSSLLTGDDSDDENVPELPSSQTSSPKKSYIPNEYQPESHGLLNQIDNDEDSIHDKEITLEWDPMDEYEEQLDVGVKREVVSVKEDPAPPQENLLLSYNEVELQTKADEAHLEDLLNLNVDIATDTLNNVQLTEVQDPQSGHLLTEMINSNPNLESFLLTTPPPPQEFASIETEPLPDEITTYTQVDEVNEENTAGNVDNLTPTHPTAVKSNDVIEVVDLDLVEKQSDTRRRNSFEQARDYGSIMD